MKRNSFFWSFLLLGCGLLAGCAGPASSDDQPAGQDTLVHVRQTSYKTGIWPAGAVIKLETASVREAGKESYVSILRVTITGAAVINGSKLEECRLRLVSYGGGGEAGAVVYLQDEGSWEVFMERTISIGPFSKKANGSWVAIGPLAAFGGSGTVANVHGMYIDDGSGESTLLAVTNESAYIQTGAGVEKYIPAMHSSGVAITIP